MGDRLLEVRLVLVRRIARDTSRAELMKPYRVMRAALDRVDRDIVFSLCQYGMGNVWEWGRRWGETSGGPPATSPTPGRA